MYEPLANEGKSFLVDSDLDTWCMKTDQIEQKITKNTRAIMPVHIYVHPTNMGPVMKLTKKQNFVVIENVAEADCAMYR